MENMGSTPGILWVREGLEEEIIQAYREGKDITETLPLEVRLLLVTLKHTEM